MVYHYQIPRRQNTALSLAEYASLVESDHVPTTEELLHLSGIGLRPLLKGLDEVVLIRTECDCCLPK